MLRRNFCLAAVVCMTFIGMQSTTEGQIIQFDLEGRAGTGLLPGNETGTISSPGIGGELTGIIFDTTTNELTIDVGWGSGNGFTDITGDASGMHIHGPADFLSNAGVKINLSALGSAGGYENSASNGGFDGVVTVADGDVQDLLDGLFYINVHTAANSGGELRGNLVQSVPEPSSIALLGTLGGALLIRRRRLS